jgi:DNA mismatch repair ATPase MutL
MHLAVLHCIFGPDMLHTSLLCSFRQHQHFWYQAEVFLLKHHVSPCSHCCVQAAVRKAVSQQSTAGQHVASTCKQQPSTSQEVVQHSDTTLHHDVSTSTIACPKGGMPSSSTVSTRIARAADAASPRQALTQQPQHSSVQKLRQQSPAAQQQQRRSFEQRLVAARATAAVRQASGGHASGSSSSSGSCGLSPSRKAPRQAGMHQKATHEMFTVWHSSALFAAM